MKKWLPLLVFVILVGFLYVSLDLNPKKLPSPLIGKPIPSVELTDFKTNQTLNSVDAVANTLSLVNVWASWCITCLAEHQQLLILSRHPGIKMVGINYKDKKTDAQNFLNKYGNPFDTILYDPNGNLGLELGVYATPETFIVDKKGIILYKYVGEITKEVLRTQIQPLLASLTPNTIYNK